MGQPRSRRRPGRGLIQALLLLSLFAAVVLAVDLLVPGARRHLDEASPGWLLVSLGLEISACLSYAALFHLIFSRPPWLLRVRRSVEIALGELGAFAIVPTGIGGPALRVWALRVGGMPWRALFVRSISHAGIFNLPYVVAAMVLGVGVSLDLLPGHAPVLTALAPLGLVLLVCAIAAGSIALARAGRLLRRWRWRRQAQAALQAIPEGVTDFGACLRRPGPLLASLGWWVGDCAALWAAFQATGGRPALSVLILAYMLGQLGNTLPLPGGVGGVEPVMLGIFAASGVDLGLAGAAIVCYRTIALGVQGALGAAAFATLAPQLRRESAQASQAAARA
jgi:uncharacterized membrane protein YbhN (UPF0104 family)